MRGVTSSFCFYCVASAKFQLTRLMRGVTKIKKETVTAITFQLTRLMRGVTSHISTLARVHLFQLTRLMRGVTQRGKLCCDYVRYFNSHASCEA